MRSKIILALATSAALTIVSAPAVANQNNGQRYTVSSQSSVFTRISQRLGISQRGNRRFNGHRNVRNQAVRIRRSGGVRSVPEIDAAGAAISLALLAGVVSIGRERRKRNLVK